MRRETNPFNGEPMTDIMHKAMLDARNGILSPWDFGAATISALKKRGWIQPYRTDGCTRYGLTDKGSAALGGVAT